MKDCIFCKVIAGDLPGKFAYQDGEVVVFHDIAPKAPVHVLIVPRKHLPSLREVTEKDSAMLGSLLTVARRLAEQLGVHSEGYKLIINNGPASGQLVDHLHIHLLGGWQRKVSWEV